MVVQLRRLPEQLLESELFGHEKGSFTGAAVAKAGLFEIADEATLFIDEIGEMPAAMQAKLLRVLEDGSMRRVGSLRERRVNVRVITATNRNLAEEVLRQSVPRGSLLPDQHDDDRLAAAARAPRRHSALHRQVPRTRLGDLAGRGGEAGTIPLARQRSSIDQRHRTGEDSRGRSVDRRLRSSPGIERSAGDASFLVRARAKATLSDDLESLQKSKIVEVLDRVGGNKTRARGSWELPAGRFIGFSNATSSEMHRATIRRRDSYAITPTSPA